MNKGCIVFTVLLLVSCLFSVPPAYAQTYLGTLPTGVIELPDYKYPVFLYVPEKYSPGKKYEMIFAIPDEGESPEEYLDFWKGVARRKSMIVLCPSILWPEDVPYRMDQWLLKIKEDVMNRYHISETGVYLIGRKSGADYGSYLATNYPEEFAAAALLGGAWGGKTEPLLRRQSRPVKQVPFFIAIPEPEKEKTAKIERRAAAFQQKGYLVDLVKVESRDVFESSSFKHQVLAWLKKNSDTWQNVIKKNQKTWKEKFRQWLDNFFRV